MKENRDSEAKPISTIISAKPFQAFWKSTSFEEKSPGWASNWVCRVMKLSTGLPIDAKFRTSEAVQRPLYQDQASNIRFGYQDASMRGCRRVSQNIRIRKPGIEAMMRSMLAALSMNDIR